MDENPDDWRDVTNAMLWPDAFKAGAPLADNPTGYRVSRDGRVMGTRGRILSPHTPDGRYSRVNLHGITSLVHRLVARAFCEGYKPGLWVNHRDGNKTNNRADNLEWTTPAQNQQHAWDTGLQTVAGQALNWKLRCRVVVETRADGSEVRHPSLTAAAQAVGGRAPAILEAIRDSGQTRYGSKWRYFDSQPSVGRKAQAGDRRIKRVQQIVGGEVVLVHDSVEAAARAMNRSRKALWLAIRDGRDMAGYEWAYV